MSDAPPPPPGDGLEIFDAETTPADDGTPAYGEQPTERLAHPGMRALAFALDGLGTLLLTTFIVFIGLFSEDFWGLYAIPIVPLASAVFATVLTATLGVTPGKWMTRLRVVHVTTRRPVGAWAILRGLVIVAPVLLTIVILQVLARLPFGGGDVIDPILGFFVIPVVLWAALLGILIAAPRHRGLQDLAGRSLVVRR
jgi:uncharacterized RDD family membrane protein YckC